jgi:hypothetical protein
MFREPGLWLKTASLGRERFRQFMVAEMRQMKADLEGPSPTPLESMLVDTLVTCWIHMNYLERCIALCHLDERPSASQLDNLGKWLDRAHRRYIQSVKVLTLVKRIDLPVVQVNIGEKQINVSG